MSVLGDTTIVRLWPIPAAFQIFFIAVIIAVISIAAAPQLSIMVNPDGTRVTCPSGYDCAQGAMIDNGLNGGSYLPTQAVDYDVLFSTVIFPLAAGILAAVATRGRSMLGRLWYGAVWGAIALMVWSVAYLALSVDTSITVFTVDGGYDTWQQLSSATLTSGAIVFVLVAADIWIQRLAYRWTRAWLLLASEVAAVTAAVIVILAHPRDGVGVFLAWTLGIFGALVAATFFVFRRRDIHLRAKFAGLVTMTTVYAGMVIGAMTQGIFGQDGMLSPLALVAGAVAAYMVAALLICRKPRPLAA